MMENEIEAYVEEEDKRLGIGSQEFRQRHDDIMTDLAEIERLNKEDKHAVT